MEYQSGLLLVKNFKIGKVEFKLRKELAAIELDKEEAFDKIKEVLFN